MSDETVRSTRNMNPEWSKRRGLGGGGWRRITFKVSGRRKHYASHLKLDQLYVCFDECFEHINYYWPSRDISATRLSLMSFKITWLSAIAPYLLYHPNFDVPLVYFKSLWTHSNDICICMSFDGLCVSFLFCGWKLFLIWMNDGGFAYGDEHFSLVWVIEDFITIDLFIEDDWLIISFLSSCY